MRPMPSSSTCSAPERPSASASQSTSAPPAAIGLTTPAPVMTTRRRTSGILAEHEARRRGLTFVTSPVGPDVTSA